MHQNLPHKIQHKQRILPSHFDALRLPKFSGGGGDFSGKKLFVPADLFLIYTSHSCRIPSQYREMQRESFITGNYQYIDYCLMKINSETDKKFFFSNNISIRCYGKVFYAPLRLRNDLSSRMKHRQLSTIDKNHSCVRTFWAKFARFLARQQQILLLIFVTRIHNSCRKKIIGEGQEE